MTVEQIENKLDEMYDNGADAKTLEEESKRLYGVYFSERNLETVKKSASESKHPRNDWFCNVFAPSFETTSKAYKPESGYGGKPVSEKQANIFFRYTNERDDRHGNLSYTCTVGNRWYLLEKPKYSKTWRLAVVEF